VIAGPGGAANVGQVLRAVGRQGRGPKGGRKPGDRSWEAVGARAGIALHVPRGQQKAAQRRQRAAGEAVAAWGPAAGEAKPKRKTRSARTAAQTAKWHAAGGRTTGNGEDNDYGDKGGCELIGRWAARRFLGRRAAWPAVRLLGRRAVWPLGRAIRLPWRAVRLLGRWAVWPWGRAVRLLGWAVRLLGLWAVWSLGRAVLLLGLWAVWP
jgi:hypothetical protein